MRVLGTPLGHPDYVAQFLRDKRREQDSLLERIPAVQDVQVAWLLLLMCASPRSNYLLRALAPSVTLEYAMSHDAAVQACLGRILANESPAELTPLQVRRAQLPLRRGGCGLRSAVRLRFAAHWASWADTLEVIRHRDAAAAARLLENLGAPGGGPLASTRGAVEAATTVATGDFIPPAWASLANGLRPPRDRGEVLELGEFARGWQRVASIARDASEQNELLRDLDEPSRALLHSQSGPYGGRAFTALPTGPEFRVDPALYRVMLLRRLRAPLPVVQRTCPCRRFLDPLGDHRAACSNAGVLGARGVPLEEACARICQEAGGRVVQNCFLRDMNLDVPVADARRIEVMASRLPAWAGAQVAVDATLVSPVRRDGSIHPGTALTPGISLERAERRKREVTYRELLRARRCRLIVFGLEVGGRWSDGALDLVRRLARGRARQVPSFLRQAAAQGYAYRWSALAAVAAQRALAASLLHLNHYGLEDVAGPGPSPSDLLADARWDFEVAASRMPVP